MAENFGVEIPITADGQGATAEINKVARSIDNMGESSAAASKRIESAQEETQQQLKKTAKQAEATGEVQEESSKKATKAAQKAAQRAQKEWESAYSSMKQSVLNFGESVNSTMLNMASNIAQKGLGMLTSTVGNFISEGFSLQKELESVSVALDTMSTAGADTATVLKQIQKNAIRTPFDVASLSKATQRFTMITGNAEEAERVVLNFGKALAAAGKGSVEMTRIATNMQQIGNQARISQKDFNEFATAGVNMTKLIAEYANIGENEVMDYLKKWQTGVDKGMTEAQLLAKGVRKPYDILVGAINKATESGGKFANVYEDLAGTLPQTINNMKESIASGFASVFANSGLEKELKNMAVALGDVFTDSPLIEEATNAVKHLLDVIKELLGVTDGASVIQSVFGAITEFLRDLASGKYDTVIKNIFTAVKSFLSVQAQFNPLVVGLKLLSQVLAMLPEGAGEVLGKIAGGLITLASAIGMYSKIKSTFEPITDLISATKGLRQAGSIVEEAGSALSTGGGKISGALTVIQNKFTSFTNFLTGILNNLASIGRAITNVVGQTIAGLLEPLGSTSALKGAATMVVLAGAFYVFGKSLQAFAKLSWGDLGKAAATLAVLLGVTALAGLGPVAAVLKIGALALAAVSAAFIVFGAALLVVSAGIQRLSEASQTDMNFGNLLAQIGGMVTVAVALTAAAPFMAVAAVSAGALTMMAVELLVAAAAVNAIPKVTRNLGDVLGLVAQLEIIGVALAAGTLTNLLGALSGMGLLAIATELLGIATAVNAIPQTNAEPIKSLQPAFDALSEMGKTLSKGLIDNLRGAISGGALLAVANEVKSIAFALSELPTVDTGPMESLVPAINKLHDISEALSGKIMENLKAMFSGGALLVVANEVKSIACALSETPVVNTQGIESIQGAVGKLQEISSSLAEHAFDNLLGAGSGAGLLVVANEIKSIAFALNDTPVIDPKGIESIEANIGRLQAISDRLAGDIFKNLFGAASGAGLLAVANEIKSVAYAMNEAGQQLAGVDLSQFDKLDSITDICQRIGDLTDDIPVEKTQRIRDMFDALGDAFDNEVGEKVYQAVKMLQKTNWATFATDMEHLTEALNRDYPDLGNFVNFFDRIGDALDNGVIDNMGKLIETFLKNDKSKMDLAMSNAGSFVSFIQGNDQTKEWDQTAVTNFMNFFDRVGDALDQSVVPNIGALLDVFNKFSKAESEKVLTNAQGFVNFVQGTDQTKNWDATTADKFMKFFDKVGWALDNDVSPNMEKLLNVFNNFSKENMTKTLANAQAFVEFVQGSGLPEKSKNWNINCVTNFMKFFDKVGWALDNDVVPNIEKLLNVFNAFSAEQIGTITANAKSFVDFINGELFQNGEGDNAWSLDAAQNFMEFFDKVGWALDNNVGPAIESLLKAFNMSEEAFAPIIKNMTTMVGVINGTNQELSAVGGWNTANAENFMKYFDFLVSALNEGIIDSVKNLFSTFNEIKTEKVVEKAKELANLVSGNNGEFSWTCSDAETFTGYMNKLNELEITPEKIKNFFEGFTNVKTNGAVETANALAQVIAKISEAFATYKPEMERTGASLGDSLIKGWNTKKDAIKQLATDAGNSIKDTLESFGGEFGPLYWVAEGLISAFIKPFQTHDWSSHGKFAAEGIKNGASSKANDLYLTGFDLAQALTNGIKNGGEEGSPWKLTRQSGIFAAEGLIDGARSMINDVSDMGEEIANALMQGYNDSIETLTADAQLGDALGEASAYGERQAITNNKNVTITNNNTVNSELDMAMVNSRLNWEINHAL